MDGWRVNVVSVVLLAKTVKSKHHRSSFSREGVIIGARFYNIGGWSEFMTGSTASLTKSKATMVIHQATNSSDQTVGGINWSYETKIRIFKLFLKGIIIIVNVWRSSLV